MSDTYLADCPKCNDEVIEFNFVDKNGFVGFCQKQGVLLYYCSIFGKVTVFKNTKEEIEMPFTQLKYKSEKHI